MQLTQLLWRCSMKPMVWLTQTVVLLAFSQGILVSRGCMHKIFTGQLCSTCLAEIPAYLQISLPQDSWKYFQWHVKWYLKMEVVANIRTWFLCSPWHPVAQRQCCTQHKCLFDTRWRADIKYLIVIFDTRKNCSELCFFYTSQKCQIFAGSCFSITWL